MASKDTTTQQQTSVGEPEFSIGGEEDDDATNMSAMPVTQPSLAPTLDQIQTEVNHPPPPQQSTYNNNNNSNGTTYPDIANPSSYTTTTTAPEGVNRTMFGPSGRWSRGVFACLDSTFFSALFWMGFCCTPILYGQLAQRLNLTWLGTQPPPPQRASGTCMAILVVTLLTYCVFLLANGWIVTLLWYLFCFYFFFLGILLRSVVRKRFGIAPAHIPACDGALEDGALAACCCCCSAIQMARHTHDEYRYPYNACSNNGLLSYAPDLADLDHTLLDDNRDPPFNPHSTNGGEATPPEGAYLSNVEIV